MSGLYDVACHPTASRDHSHKPSPSGLGQLTNRPNPPRNDRGYSNNVYLLRVHEKFAESGWTGEDTAMFLRECLRQSENSKQVVFTNWYGIPGDIAAASISAEFSPEETRAFLGPEASADKVRLLAGLLRPVPSR